MSETKPPNEGCRRAYIFDGQRTVQMMLVFVAMACVPVMLLGTPFYLIKQNKINRQKAEARIYFPFFFSIFFYTTFKELSSFSTCRSYWRIWKFSIEILSFLLTKHYPLHRIRFRNIIKFVLL